MGNQNDKQFPPSTNLISKANDILDNGFFHFLFFFLGFWFAQKRLLNKHILNIGNDQDLLMTKQSIRREKTNRYMSTHIGESLNFHEMKLGRHMKKRFFINMKFQNFNS